ncbi:MAG: hypothetical protein ACR2MM_01215, partial [Flavobacteriaceae bacterium]
MSIQAIPLSQFIPSNTTQFQTVVQSTASFIHSLAKKGGPDQTDYPLLNTLFQQFSQTNLQETLSTEQLASIHDSFGAALSPETIQGWAFQKPLGYAGDFKIIEKIYNLDRSSVPH